MRGPGLGMFMSHMRNRTPTKKCGRCGLKYKIDEENCPHCHNLSDTEVDALKQRFAREQIGNQRLGRMLLMTAALCLLILLAIGLFGG